MSDRPPAKVLRFLKQYGKLQPSERFHYVTIHPLADEPAVLQRAGVRSEDCLIVDCYWAVDNAVALVSVYSAQDGRAYAWYLREKDATVPHSFYVSTLVRPLTTVALERVLARLAKWFDVHRDHLPREKVVFTEEDLGVE